MTENKQQPEDGRALFSYEVYYLQGTLNTFKWQVIFLKVEFELNPFNSYLIPYTKFYQRTHRFYVRS